MRTRLVRSAALAVALTTVSAGAAAAHDCFNVSRSERGNVAAGEHSGSWVSIGTLAELYATPPDPSFPALTPAQVEWAVAEARALGFPNTALVFVRGTIADGTPAQARNGGNGKGIDYLDAWFPRLIEIYVAALQH